MQEIFNIFAQKREKNLIFENNIWNKRKDLQRKTWRSFAIKKKTTTKNINRDAKRQVFFGTL